MTKAELIERVYGGKHLPRELTKKTVAQIVDAVFTEMGDYFIRTRVSRNQGARLTYPGFGTFSKRRRPPRMVRNPQTGDPITIPPQETITFSPGQELRSLLNRNGKRQRRRFADGAAAVKTGRALVAAPPRYTKRCSIPAWSWPTCTSTSAPPSRRTSSGRSRTTRASSCRCRPTGSSATWSPPSPRRCRRWRITSRSCTTGRRRFSRRRPRSSGRSTRSSARSSGPAACR